MAYEGFSKLKAIIEKKEGKKAKDAGAIAASIARKKYGNKAVEEHAHKGTSMEHAKINKVFK